MKVIIAGPRDLDVPVMIVQKMVEQSGFKITELVSGAAAGVDFSGECWAAANNIPIKLFEAQWEEYGKAAGPKRNKQMAEYADALLVIKWPQDTPGTKNMMDTMHRKKKPVHVEVVELAEESTDAQDQN